MTFEVFVETTVSVPAFAAAANPTTATRTSTKVRFMILSPLPSIWRPRSGPRRVLVVQNLSRIRKSLVAGNRARARETGRSATRAGVELRHEEHAEVGRVDRAAAVHVRAARGRNARVERRHEEHAEVGRVRCAALVEVCIADVAVSVLIRVAAKRRIA